MNTCRLCGEKSEYEFSQKIMNKFECKYYKCQSCGSLQTEEPYWLDEAYSSNLTFLDTGAVQRNVNNMSAIIILSKIFGFKNILDFGGGDGLLCRFLRDHCLNAYVSDRHAVPVYAPAYVVPDFSEPDLLTAFEVFEHFVNPSIEIEQLFMKNPSALLISTEVYREQNSDWWYLSPETGQHIFFYSENALKMISKKYNYTYMRIGSYIFYIRDRDVGPITSFCIKKIFRKRLFRLVRSYLFYVKTPGVLSDFNNLRGG